MKTELYSAVAVLLYIVFLSHSPPRVLRDLLSNEYIAFVVFAACAYVTLWRSRTVGVLLILAFILTMTRVTEHLDVPPATPDTPPTETPPTPPTNTPPPPPPPAPSTTPTVDASTTPGMTASTPPTPTTPVTVSATTAPSPAQPPPPIAAPPPPPTAPATPPVPTAPPAPVMSCNIESFASF